MNICHYKCASEKFMNGVLILIGRDRRIWKESTSNLVFIGKKRLTGKIRSGNNYLIGMQHMSV